jgi:hypothetical protein
LGISGHLSQKRREVHQGGSNPSWRPSCTIKSNISAYTGEHIYHLPGDTYYSETRVRLLRGERWFCSEAEARAAGWRWARL